MRGRNSDNRLIREKLGWGPSAPLREGLEKTYAWIEQQMEQLKRDQEAPLLRREGCVVSPCRNLS